MLLASSGEEPPALHLVPLPVSHGFATGRTAALSDLRILGRSCGAGPLARVPPWLFGFGFSRQAGGVLVCALAESAAQASGQRYGRLSELVAQSVGGRQRLAPFLVLFFAYQVQLLIALGGFFMFTGSVVIIITLIALFFTEETFHKDLDYLEEL